jgi:hypothetical protein
MTFFSNTATNRTNIPMYNLQTNQQDFLGIPPDSAYYGSINTANCYVMKDGYSIPMGGLATSQ